MGESSGYDDRPIVRERVTQKSVGLDKTRVSRGVTKKDARRTLFEESTTDYNSESESSAKQRMKKSYRDAGRRSKVIKILKDWDIKFSGTDSDDPEELLERIEDCQRGELFSDEELLQAIPSIFKDDASRWFRTYSTMRRILK